MENSQRFPHIRESSKTFSRKIHAGESPWATSVPATSSQAHCCVLRAASCVSWADKWESNHALAIELVNPWKCFPWNVQAGSASKSLSVFPLSQPILVWFMSSPAMIFLWVNLCAPLQPECKSLRNWQNRDWTGWVLTIPQQQHRDTHRPQGATKQPQQRH